VYEVFAAVAEAKFGESAAAPAAALAVAFKEEEGFSILCDPTAALGFRKASMRPHVPPAARAIKLASYIKGKEPVR